MNGGHILSRNTHFLGALLLLSGLAVAASAQTTITTVSAANYGPIVAPESIASVFGTNLATTTTPAMSMPLPTTLGNTTVSITDSAKNMQSAQLIFVSPTQINFIVPENLALGKATIAVNSNGTSSTGSLLISNISPAFFTANASGSGAPAAQQIRVDSTGAQTTTYLFQGSAGNYTPTPVALTPGTVYLVLWGTGFRRHSANPVIASIKGTKIPVTYVGVQNDFAGLDQIDIGPLPSSIAGSGMADLVITIDGIPANMLQLAIQ